MKIPSTHSSIAYVLADESKDFTDSFVKSFLEIFDNDRGNVELAYSQIRLFVWLNFRRSTSSAALLLQKSYQFSKAFRVAFIVLRSFSNGESL